MAGAPKGNKNALKHGLYAGRGKRIEGAQDVQVQKATFAIVHLEETIERICKRMEEADGEAFTRLANALAISTTALFNGHRTISYLTGGMTPMEQALRELETLDFEED